MTEQEIKTLADELETLANTIENDLNNLSAATQTQESLQNDLEDFRAEAMKAVLQNKLIYTNDDWRKIGVRDAESESLTAQNTKGDLAAQKQIVAGLHATIEKNRKVYRAKELLLLFAANH